MKIRFTGFDSAWGGKEKGALCNFEGRTINGNFSLSISDDPLRVNWEEAISKIGDWKKHENHVVAIDQGLIVPNLTRQRPVERKLASALMGAYGCGCHSSNRSNEPCYGAKSCCRRHQTTGQILFRMLPTPRNYCTLQFAFCSQVQSR